MKCTLVKKGEYWYITYYENTNGKYKKIWISTGEKGNRPSSNVKEKLTEIQYKLNSNLIGKSDNTSLSAVTNFWLEKSVKGTISQTTYDGYETIIEKYIEPYFKDTPIQKVLPMHIDAYYEHLQKKCYSIKTKKPLSGNSVYRHHAILNQVFEYAMINKFTNINACKGVRLPKKTKFKTTVYNESEVQELVDLIEGSEIESLVHLAVGLGLRLSEICGLKWENVNFDNNTIYIAEARVRKKSGGTITKETKNESSTRLIKVPEFIMMFLYGEKSRQAQLKLDINQEDDYVVQRYDGKIPHPSTLSHRFSDFLKKNKLKQIRLHDLRHTNITLLLKNKIDFKTIQTRGGWSDVKTMFNIYSHVLQEMEQDACEKINYSIYKNKKKSG